MNIFKSLQTYVSRKKEERDLIKYQQSLLTNKYLSIIGRNKDQYIQSKGKKLPNGDIETVVYTDLGPIRETIVSPKNTNKNFSIQYDGLFLEPNKHGELEEKYGLVEYSVNQMEEGSAVSLFCGIFDVSQFNVYTHNFIIPSTSSSPSTIDISAEALKMYETPETNRLIFAYSSLKNSFDYANSDEMNAEI